jgi:hypothetical protein
VLRARRAAPAAHARRTLTCSIISMLTTRSKLRPAPVKSLMSQVTTSTLARPRAAACASMKRFWLALLLSAVKETRGKRAAAKSVKEPQPQPMSSTRVPATSSSLARSHTSRSASSSLASSVVAGAAAAAAAPRGSSSGQRPQLYFLCLPMTSSKKAAGTT